MLSCLKRARCRRVVWRVMWRIATASLLTVGLPPLWAESGSITQLPSTRARTPSGIAIDIDTRWVAGTGYRPVRVNVINWPRGAATTERTFRIELEPTLNEWRRFDPKVEATVTLQRGQRNSEVEVYCPQSYWWNGLSIRIYEGSKELREFRTTVAVNQGGRNSWSEAVPTILFISPLADRPVTQAVRQHDLPRWDAMIQTFPGYEYYGYSTTNETSDDSAIAQAIQREPRTALLPAHRLPSNWLGLSTVDFVFIESSELQQLAKTHPERFGALRQWLELGGHLCISDVGENFEQATMVENLLELSNSPVESAESAWRPLNPADYSSAFQNPIPITNSGALTGEEITIQVQPGAPGQPVTVVPNSPPNAPPNAQANNQFSIPVPPETIPPRRREVGLGVVFLVGDDAQWRNQAHANWIFNSLAGNRWAWYAKHGMSLNRHNSGFWNWSIPGIGRVPVFLFLTVISLFAFVIGPVNFFFAMRRWRRYYLVLITVPLISVLTTISLFSYGLLRDGLGTKVRRRAYIELDQSTGRALSWSRQTYYSNIAPFGGAQFSANAAVYPIYPEPLHPSSNPHTIRWGSTQQLARGYVRSRTLSQFLVLQPFKSTAANLKFEKRAGDRQVTNELGGKISHLAVCDKDGKFFYAANVDAGATAPLKSRKTATISQLIRKDILDHSLQPEVTEGLAVGNTRRFWWGDAVDENHPSPDDTTSLLEEEIIRVRAGVTKTLQPGQYVALLKSSSMLPLGVANAEDRQSLIVVRGSW